MDERFDYAVFMEDDTYLTNALLSVEQAAEMEAKGYRCLRVRDTVGEGLPRFRGRTYVIRNRRHGRGWGHR